VDQIERSPFAEAAPYYRFRAPYPPACFDYVRDAFGLDGTHRALDLGCGPGTLSIPLSHIAGEVVAADPDPGMLAQGQADGAGRANIAWLQGRAEDLPPRLGTFRVVTMGQSFHWMDRDAVLNVLSGVVEDGGGLALFNPGKRRPQESWETAAATVVARFLGRRPRDPRANPQEPAHEPALLRSTHFFHYEAREFAGEIVRDIASIFGNLYSSSGAAKSLFGGRLGAFEDALHAALIKLNPSGVFHERLETEIMIVRKRPT
jgi:ubiquinone/menaquinone biosynthesis C-methylase UbiE